MEFEPVRVTFTLAFLLLVTYFDLFNKRNVPVWATYSMLITGFLINLASFDFYAIAYPAAVAAIVFAIGYLPYRAGQIGGADILVFSALAMLLPSAPAPLYPFSAPPQVIAYPFIFPIFIISGLLSVLGISVIYLPRVLGRALQGDMKISRQSAVSAAIIFISYMVVLHLMYTVFGFPLLEMAGVLVLVLLTALMALFKDNISETMVEWVPISQIDEEDVIDLEKLDPKIVKKYSLERVVTLSERAKLVKTRLKLFPIMKGLPAFLPYILLAFLILLLFGDHIQLFFR